MKTILLVDDNEDLRNNTAGILELSNYKVIGAENGKIGVEKAFEFIPDLIICDIIMPVLDGYGVLHAVQKNAATRSIPFIFLTARAQRSDLRKGMESGADDYITKPFDQTELLKAIDIRFKRLDLLKRELIPGVEGSNYLMQVFESKNVLMLFKDRNKNRYQKSQMIYLEGNQPNWLYYVLKGKIKAYKTKNNGKELVTGLFCPGDFLGHVALLEATAYKDTAEALEDVELALIPKNYFDELIYNNPKVAKKMIQLLVKNISMKESQLLGLAYNSLREKVAYALLMFQKKYQNSEGELVIDISRENLATIAGTATESLVRTLSEFRSEKLIDIKDNRTITIINRKRLEDLFN